VRERERACPLVVEASTDGWWGASCDDRRGALSASVVDAGRARWLSESTT
jgi:hypothetical protein